MWFGAYGVLMTYIYAVKLEDGRVFVREAQRPLKHWKSAVMREAPYGTDFLGCSFVQKVSE